MCAASDALRTPRLANGAADDDAVARRSRRKKRRTGRVVLCGGGVVIAARALGVARRSGLGSREGGAAI